MRLPTPPTEPSAVVERWIGSIKLYRRRLIIVCFSAPTWRLTARLDAKETTSMTIDVATGISRILKGCGLGFNLPCLPGEQRARPGRGADADDARRPLRRRGRRRVLAHHRGLTHRGVYLSRRRQRRRHAIRLRRNGAGL